MGFEKALTLFLLRMGFEKSPERIRSYLCSKKPNTLIRPSLPRLPLCIFSDLNDPAADPVELGTHSNAEQSTAVLLFP
jgi:hypothetical protein